MRFAVKLLVQIWLDEELRLGVQRGESGIIRNALDPLGPQDWSEIPDRAEDTGHMDAEKQSTLGGRGILSRLTRALHASKTYLSVPGEMPLAFREELMRNDLRCILANIITQIYGNDPLLLPLMQRQENSPLTEEVIDTGIGDFVEDDVSIDAEAVACPYGLTLNDLQVLTICVWYKVLREGQIWSNMRKELEVDLVSIIDPDNTMVELMRERFFRTSRKIQWEQTRLHESEIQRKARDNTSFNSKIIEQKNSILKAELLKKNAKLSRAFPSRKVVANKTSQGIAGF